MTIRSSHQALLLTTAVVAAFLVTVTAARWWDAARVNQVTGLVQVVESEYWNSQNAQLSREEQPHQNHRPDRSTKSQEPNSAVQPVQELPGRLESIDSSPLAMQPGSPSIASSAQPVPESMEHGVDGASRIAANRQTETTFGEATARAPQSEAASIPFQPLPPWVRSEAADAKPKSESNLFASRYVPPAAIDSIGEVNRLPGSNDFDVTPLDRDSGNVQPDAQLVSAVTPVASNGLPVQPGDNSFVPFPESNHFTPKSPPPANRSNPNPPVTATDLTPSSDDNSLPHALHGASNFKLAEQPQLGEHFRDDRPITDTDAHLLDPIPSDFSPDPDYTALPFEPWQQAQVYEGKRLYANQRPLLELGRPWYQLGQLSPGYNWFGKHNNIAPQFLVYGDYRTTVAANSVNGDTTSLLATELNLDLDLKLTGTERFHAFLAPLDNGVQNTRYLFDEEEFEGEYDANFDFGYFEGDLGSIVGGLVDETMPFDLPFAVGVMPLLLQNGVWMEDAFLGVAATIPARSSARFNISNMDITFFAGYDQITSPAFAGDDSAARMYGVATFIEAMNGYFEVDYAFLDDRTFDDRSYHNFAFAFSRRYGRLFSNSTRLIVNAGQSNEFVDNTADGVLLLSENSLITGAPSTLVPYLNLFAGFDRPQSAARAAQAGGVLRNTGILFEIDGMTNYPTLDATANDTYGGALGLNLIADDFSQQLVVEMAMLGVIGDDATRNAPGEQLGIGFRYQLPLSNALIFRADGMYGFLNDQPDVRGLRFELRHKW